ncbi:MAG: serine protease [Candidatus Thiodiazotropha sp. (ex Ustalcina ferruginea)]|nr:serine protease [Candidatus Thiodiazotropha sp. (ex Ustalcina ferruginea)]
MTETRKKMIVPDKIRKCVAFLGFKLEEGSFRLAGSVFWYGDIGGRVYAVTAEHVIDGIRKTGVNEVWFRINKEDGDAEWFPSKLDAWFCHPTDKSLDIAILAMGVQSDWDHRILPSVLCMTDRHMVEEEIALGDEVFVTGLFRHHHGKKRNLPIVRIGNLACGTDEKVVTKRFGEMDAYLIEARSIGGLSGSPVFLNLGRTRMIGGKLKQTTSGHQRFLLLGLIHGHYDESAAKIDGVDLLTEDVLTLERVNAGIAIVTPCYKIESLIYAYERARLNLLYTLNHCCPINIHENSSLD